MLLYEVTFPYHGGLAVKNNDNVWSTEMSTVAEFDARVLAVIEKFKASKELAQALEESQARMRGAVSGTGGSNSSSELLAKVAVDPFYISRNY